jgi:hypothetical protein
MNREHGEFGQLVELWLGTPAADEDPGTIVDRVVAQLDVIPQRQRSWWPARNPRHPMDAWGGSHPVIVTVAVASAAVVIAGVVGGMITGPHSPGGVPPMASQSDFAPSSSAETSLPPASPAGDILVGPYASGGERLTVAGTPMSFVVPGYGSWEAHGRPYVSKSVFGPQGAEAIVYWAGFPESQSADPCPRVLGTSIGHAAADLATAVSIAPGTELAEDVSDVTVGGRSAKHVVVTIQDDFGCDPGYFYTWEPFPDGALWPETAVGDTIRVWIADVDGRLIFIAAATKPDPGSRVLREIQDMIDSIRFE